MNKLTHKQELQKVFDTVAVHLMTQKKKASHTHEKGRFYFLIRPIDGARCALGCLLPANYKYEDARYLNNLYFPSDITAQSLQQTDSGYKFQIHQQHSFIEEIKACGFNLSWVQDRFFLSRLQRIHDEYSVEQWYKELQELAFNYGLNQDKFYKAMIDNNAYDKYHDSSAKLI